MCLDNQTEEASRKITLKTLNKLCISPYCILYCTTYLVHIAARRHLVPGLGRLQEVHQLVVHIDLLQAAWRDSSRLVAVNKCDQSPRETNSAMAEKSTTIEEANFTSPAFAPLVSISLNAHLERREFC